MSLSIFFLSLQGIHESLNKTTLFFTLSYPAGVKPVCGQFPERNRLISGLSDAVVVVEARAKSGSLITVDQALEQNKDVYVIPGRVGDSLSEGCNKK